MKAELEETRAGLHEDTAEGHQAETGAENAPVRATYADEAQQAKAAEAQQVGERPQQRALAPKPEAGAE
jgi:hypothetical protein